MKIHGEQRPDFAVQIEGMRNYLWKCAGGMNQTLYAVLDRTYHLSAVYGTVSEPGLTESAANFLGRMAGAGCGFIFRANAIHTPDLGLLVGPGEVNEENRPMYWADALDRRGRTMALLQARGHAVPGTLPPVAAVEEVRFRTPEEVLERAVALHAVAARGIPPGIGRRRARALTRDFPEALSPAESEFLQHFFPSKADKAKFSWRIEAAVILLWALRAWDEAPSLSEPTSLERMNAVMQRIKETGNPGGSLRPAAEILDQLDLVYRYHWLVTEARVRGIPGPAEVNGSTIFERHCALNWLTCHHDREWDEVETDT
jgi:hypothetical protein